MNMIFLGVIVILFVTVILSVLITYYNNYQVAIIKISEAEENIKILLTKKMELLVLIRNTIEDKNKNVKISDFDITNKKMNSFELNKELNIFNKKITEIVEYSKDVKLNDDEKKLVSDLKNINIELEGNERYYNDNVVIYNKLIKCFPSNIVGKIYKYKVKDFYSKEKEEIFEILKK